jgi:hypothetical protein
MEQAERAELMAQSASPQLRVFNAAVRNILKGYANANASTNEVMNFLRGAYKPFGIEIAHKDAKQYFSASEIARKCRLWSVTNRPHKLAVSAIIDKLKIAPEHITIVPYGLTGISLRYDDCVAEAVCDWLKANNYPRRIPHHGFSYHVQYGNILSVFWLRLSGGK